MSAIEIVNELRRAGAIVEGRGDRLRIRAPRGVLTSERCELLRRHKADVLAWLNQPSNQRAIVRFALVESPDSWPIVIGAPGETYDDVVSRLRQRYGERLAATEAYRRGGDI